MTHRFTLHTWWSCCSSLTLLTLERREDGRSEGEVRSEGEMRDEEGGQKIREGRKDEEREQRQK